MGLSGWLALAIAHDVTALSSSPPQLEPLDIVGAHMLEPRE